LDWLGRRLKRVNLHIDSIYKKLKSDLVNEEEQVNYKRRRINEIKKFIISCEDKCMGIDECINIALNKVIVCSYFESIALRDSLGDEYT
jgi:hypothetical protein